MAMNVGESHDDEPMVEMNTTPLIDVMLVLLVMLIITIPIQMHAVQLDMPVPNQLSKPPEPPKVVKIWILPNGDILWNGEPMNSRAMLEDKLYQESLVTPQPEFHIKPDPATKYKYVALVLASAQRLGLQKLGVFGNE